MAVRHIIYVLQIFQAVTLTVGQDHGPLLYPEEPSYPYAPHDSSILTDKEPYPNQYDYHMQPLPFGYEPPLVSTDLYPQRDSPQQKPPAQPSTASPSGDEVKSKTDGSVSQHEDQPPPATVTPPPEPNPNPKLSSFSGSAGSPPTSSQPKQEQQIEHTRIPGTKSTPCELTPMKNPRKFMADGHEMDCPDTLIFDPVTCRCEYDHKGQRSARAEVSVGFRKATTIKAGGRLLL